MRFLVHLEENEYRLAVVALTWTGCAVVDLPDEIARHLKGGLALLITNADRDAMSVERLVPQLLLIAAAAQQNLRDADGSPDERMERLLQYLGNPPDAEVLGVIAHFMSDVWARVAPDEIDRAVEHFEENVFPRFAMFAPHLYGGTGH